MTELPTSKKRSKPLSVWLILIPILNSTITIVPIFVVTHLWIPVIAINVTLNIVFGYAAWKWRKWGVWGLGVMSVLAALVGWLSSYYPIVFPIVTVEVVLLAIVARRAWNQFKWR
jgi:hypothetical protein